MNPSRVTAPLLVAAGLLLAGFATSSLRDHGALRHQHNPFAIQQSAYGKLLARLSETTIDRAWHLGVEQVVPHYMSGIAHGAEAEGGKEAADPTTTATGSAATAAAIAAGETGPVQKGKRWIQDRVIAQHTRTNPNALSPAHLATVYRDIENMLLQSFKLDPTHYGSYDSYHLFLTTTDFGGTPVANEQARKIAQIAIATAEAENEDPEPWLTAAAAGMNLYLMEVAPYNLKNEPVPLELLVHHRDLIGHCLSRFEEIQARSEQSGNWDNLSLERQMEIAELAVFAKRTYKQFETLIARAEAKATGKEVPAADGSRGVAGTGERNAD
jgi:hypothetical protein